jgi:hypothetical protein
MVTQLNRSQVQWTLPSALWGDMALSGSGTAGLQKPVLLGFKSDTFMRDLLAVAQSNPAQIKDYIVNPASFRTPPLGPLLSWLTPPPGPLKFYLPIHGCFYLVLASLVDILPDLLPDHAVDVLQQESARFVLRCLSASGNEMAWVSDPDRTPPSNKTWLELSADQQTKSVPGEALLPLFPVKYPDTAAPGKKRRMLAGYIPTMSSETYQPSPGATAQQPKLDPTGKALYIVRCIYSRPKCVPSVSDVVSEPTEPFQIASIYDSDAPARPSHFPAPPEIISATVDKLRHLLSGT